uniref:Uncharacterized protein n=1 Tax=Trypanosoma congolense (strain IL3000) TaxID=1068625 RepID=F9WBN3_TRYCI|nr:hypothetical protein, unlikely [Trypanosoma congolense IL3000]
MAHCFYCTPRVRFFPSESTDSLRAANELKGMQLDTHEKRNDVVQDICFDASVDCRPKTTNGPTQHCSVLGRGRTHGSKTKQQKQNKKRSKTVFFFFFLENLSRKRENNSHNRGKDYKPETIWYCSETKVTRERKV